MKKENKNVAIYQTAAGEIVLRQDIQATTLWATQAQIAEVFNIERSDVTKHIRNILKDKELNKQSVCAKFAHTATDGKKYNVQYYNLDVMLVVGYRTNSVRAIRFRQWATNAASLEKWRWDFLILRYTSKLKSDKIQESKRDSN